MRRIIQRNVRVAPQKPPVAMQAMVKAQPSIHELSKLLNSDKTRNRIRNRNMGSKLVRARPPVVKPAIAELPPKILTLEEINQQNYIDTINNNRTCIINQFAGLGDIIFCEPIARMYHEKGYKVIWPVEPYYCNINKHFPYITFINKALININYELNKFQTLDNSLIIPLRFSDRIMDVPYHRCMASKYMMWNLPLITWKTTKWVRDEKSEKELFYNVLRLKVGEQYNLISEHFSRGKIQITPPPGKNVYLERISDYTLIDWSMVMENATTIHAVGSAINYVLEFLKTNECHLYPRKPVESDFKNYDYLFEKSYIKHP